MPRKRSNIVEDYIANVFYEDLDLVNPNEYLKSSAKDFIRDYDFILSLLVRSCSDYDYIEYHVVEFEFIKILKEYLTRCEDLLFAFQDNYSHNCKYRERLIDGTYWDYHEPYKTNVPRLWRELGTKILYIERKEEIVNSYNIASEKYETTLRHETIFINDGFKLWEYILNNFVKDVGIRGRQSDLIFFYWKLQKLNFIHRKPIEFFRWFESINGENIGQLKTYGQVQTLQRNKDFASALDWLRYESNKE